MPEIDNGKGIELILSILLATSVSYALTLFVDFGDTAWLIFSLLAIMLVIFVIYSILDLKFPEKASEWFMLISLSIGILLPFSLSKMRITENPLTTSTGNWWGLPLFLIHLGLFGASLIFWGAFNNPKKVSRIWAGIITIIITLIITAISCGGILQ